MPKPLDLRPTEGALRVMRGDLADLDEKLSQMRSTGYATLRVLAEALQAGVERSTARAAVDASAESVHRAERLLTQSVTELTAAVASHARLVDLITEARGK